METLDPSRAAHHQGEGGMCQGTQSLPPGARSTRQEGGSEGILGCLSPSHSANPCSLEPCSPITSLKLLSGVLKCSPIGKTMVKFQAILVRVRREGFSERVALSENLKEFVTGGIPREAECKTEMNMAEVY